MGSIRRTSTSLVTGLSHSESVWLASAYFAQAEFDRQLKK
jgi:hypothetical protein